MSETISNQKMYKCSECPGTMTEIMAYICLSCDQGNCLEDVDGHLRIKQGMAEECEGKVICGGCVLHDNKHSGHACKIFIKIKIEQAFYDLKKNVDRKIKETFGEDRLFDQNIRKAREARKNFVQVTRKVVESTQTAPTATEFDSTANEISTILEDAKSEQDHLFSLLQDYITKMKEFIEEMKHLSSADVKVDELEREIVHFDLENIDDEHH